MPRGESTQELARYLVEVTPPPDREPDIGELAARARAASEAVSKDGALVRLLRSVFVPEDGSCLLVFEATSAEAVRRAMGRTGLALERLTEAEVAR
jgi:hypothetical protein